MDLRTRWRPGQPLFHCTVAGDTHTVQVDRAGIAYRLAQAGVEVEATVLRPRVAALLAGIPAKAPADTSRALLSPMPGRLSALLVELGQTVKAGEELAIVEAMKMENILNADRDGIVKTIHVQPGDNLTADQAILEFE